MSGYRLLAHTADMGIEATGASPQEVFVAAARGLQAMMFSRAPIAAVREVPVTVHGTDQAELLVAWLGEILYLFEVQQLAPSDYIIDDIRHDTLNGRVMGEAFDPDRHPIEREVKAITYHQVRVWKEKSGWRARVYVDL
ncbi:MAG: archease [Desulfuromonadaceae bacterium]